jgi:hypothetical protein
MSRYSCFVLELTPVTFVTSCETQELAVELGTAKFKLHEGLPPNISIYEALPLSSFCLFLTLIFFKKSEI